LVQSATTPIFYPGKFQKPIWLKLSQGQGSVNKGNPFLVTVVNQGSNLPHTFQFKGNQFTKGAQIIAPIFGAFNNPQGSNWPTQRKLGTPGNLRKVGFNGSGSLNQGQFWKLNGLGW